MRKFFTLALISLTVGALSLGCGSKKNTTSGTAGSSTGGSSGSGGSSAGAGGSSAGAGGSSAGAAGSSGDCTGKVGMSACSMCIEGACCPEIDACLADASCTACAGDSTTPGCDTNMLYTALTGCANTGCADACKPPDGACARYCCTDADCGTGKCVLGRFTDFPMLGVCLDQMMMAVACDAPAMSTSMGSCFTKDMNNVCNPVTNDGCTMAGAACDLDGSSGFFGCFPSGNTEALCATCNNGPGPYCQATLHCTVP